MTEESTTEWPQRPKVGAKEPLPASKIKPRLTVGRSRPTGKISRRRLLGLGARSGVAALALGALGRGSYETTVDIKKGLKLSVRAFASLPRFFHDKPGAVQVETALVAIEPQKPKSEFYEVFHNLSGAPLEQAKIFVRQMHGVISQNPEYQKGSLYEVTKKYENLIRAAAENSGFNPNLAIGIIFVENGGGEAVRNQNSGATGVAQLMPETAKRYGLRVDEAVDERKNPEKSIEAMGKYLKDLKLEFLDNGIACWAYHAGEGNIYSALRSYFKDVDGKDYGDVIQAPDATVAEKYRRQIMERGLNVHKVLQNSGVKAEVLSQLTDETELYVYKVIAASQLFQVNKETFG